MPLVLPGAPSAPPGLQMFKGGVRVYDTINTPARPVPTDGMFVNAGWVEVFSPDHDFVGDCVVTNGLELLLFQVATAHLASLYLWSTGLAVAAWQMWATLDSRDNAGNGATLRAYTLARVSKLECSLIAEGSTVGGNAMAELIRLQAGRFEVRCNVRPRTQASTTNFSLVLTLVATPKILYNSTKVADNVLSEASPAFATDYGYGACFVANAGQPFIAGILYQSEPGNAQPFSAGNSAAIGLGDTTSLAANADRAYGFFAIPYGANASYSTASLQAEAESGTLGTGWSSVVDAAQSAGNVAKCVSGTLTGNADLWGTAFIPEPGIYDLWVRIKVSSAAGGSNEMQIGLWNSTDSAFVASTTYKPNQVTAGYLWYKVAAGVSPTAAKSMRVRAVTVATLGTDWFMDESALVPITLVTDRRGPQELFQQFMYDRDVAMLVGA